MNLVGYLFSIRKWQLLSPLFHLILGNFIWVKFMGRMLAQLQEYSNIFPVIIYAYNFWSLTYYNHNHSLVNDVLTRVE